MKIKLLIFAFMLSIRLSGQSDTTIYFSMSFSRVQTIDEATYYENLVKSSDNKYLLNSFVRNDGNWKKVSETKIQRQSDSSFLVNSSSDDYFRIYHKLDSGYMIHDVIRPNANAAYHTYYNWEGFSQTLFPLIRSGVWRSYSIFTGDLQFEEFYQDNRLVSCKYWINDSTYIKDVYRYITVPPKFQGGDEALKALIYNNINYPSPNIHGKVIVSFVILKNGQITGIKPLNKINKALTQEVIRLVNLSQKKWIPAKIGNTNVNSIGYFPITFQLK